MRQAWIRHLGIAGLTLSAVAVMAYRPPVETWLSNRLPEAAPYNVKEAQVHPPPYEEVWEQDLQPGSCGSCHARIFEEWNGSMMANSWRDPAWRAAFLLSARQTATDGNCDVPQPPDGSERAQHNPFDVGDCTSRFDLGNGQQTISRSGSLLDGFCSRCHMPSNYVDNVPLHRVGEEPTTGLEDAEVHPAFDPTSDAGTGYAYAEVEERFRNTETGRRGIFCAVCHTMAESRDTPFSNYRKTGEEYRPVLSEASRSEAVPARKRLAPQVPAPSEPHLGYGIGAGSFRLSPQAITSMTTFGPLAGEGEVAPGEMDPYLSGVFGREMPLETIEPVKHEGFGHAKFPRAEMCAACHDVTNPLTLKNPQDRWVGGFPIERTYTEWLTSRYADRPGNENFDPGHKRDCQTCHMQQDYGQPGTAQTLYEDGRPAAPLTGRPAESGPDRSVYFSHHFIGGNAYVPHLIGADVDLGGRVQPWPKLSVFSFSSADPESPYYNAYWTDVDDRGPPTHHGRLAWDRLRNVVELELQLADAPEPDGRLPVRVRVTNTGSGHNFPSGFPEGRVGWISLRAFDLATGDELPIHDAHWDRTSLGVGKLTDRSLEDPNFDEACHWKLPAGSPDPYAYQMKAVASKGDGCPTLDLVYAAPLNLVTNEDGLPVDTEGRVIDRQNQNPPQFEDLDGDGDLYDDAFLVDQRLRPLPHDGATVDLRRYSVVVSPGTLGPVAVTAAVYYQSLEGIVAEKFLGNLADTDLDRRLEPCVLDGLCDGRTPNMEPAAVEGSPPVPMEVVSGVLALTGSPEDRQPPRRIAVYPPPDTQEAYGDVVVKATFSEPVFGLDATRFTLEDAAGKPVPAFVDQIGDGTWALFPHRVFLDPGSVYTARLEGPVCDAAGNCRHDWESWDFRVTPEPHGGRGDTSVPYGFPGTLPPRPNVPPAVTLASSTEDGGLRLAFSEPVMNLTVRTLQVREGKCEAGRPVSGRIELDESSSEDGRAWVFRASETLKGTVCVRVDDVYDLVGLRMTEPWFGSIRMNEG